MLAPPNADEYFEFYGGYVALVPPGDLLQHLVAQLRETMSLLSQVPESQAGRAYAPGKWTLKEVVVHMSDAERVFAYRLLRIGRGDRTPLAGFEQDEWIPLSGANDRTLASLVDEFATVRAATVQLVGNLPVDAWERRGTASGHEISVRALVYICAGHELHHQRIIREKYLA